MAATTGRLAFVLGVILIQEENWLHALDRVVDMRRHMRNQWGLSPRAELKAFNILAPKREFRDLQLSRKQRLDIYALSMSALEKLDVFQTFAVCIDKSLVKKREYDPRTFAWQFVLERLDNYATRNSEWVTLFPDAGHGYFIRQMVRRLRRFHRVPSAFGGGVVNAQARRIIEDPSDRDSQDSYFVQLADLVAYAAHRYIFPTQKFGRDAWEMLGESRLVEVNKIAGGPPGIKVFPTV